MLAWQIAKTTLMGSQRMISGVRGCPQTHFETGSELKCYKSLFLRSQRQHDAFDLTEVEDRYLEEATAHARGEQRRRAASLSVSVETHDDPINL